MLNSVCVASIMNLLKVGTACSHFNSLSRNHDIDLAGFSSQLMNCGFQ
jgi:hypothetical protein|uniref:Uncharacterized protein n=1 Tax=Curvibacter symbiont subsp. Hydra magnipapillata TaxID=667019 RepID=C9YBZ3_CURXX|nr:hypothetical protein Csp_C22220 [Curvibacter putative symbiont of Hydra magnipapillata]